MGLSLSTDGGIPAPAWRATLDELKSARETFDWEAVAAYEKDLRHDVMAHVHAYGDQCPDARPIIHLGATSAFVADNASLIQQRDALRLVRDRLAAAVAALAMITRLLTCESWAT